METKKLSLYYFTGTGNTYLAALKIAEVFGAGNIYAIENSDPKNIDLNSVIGIGFPIAVWNTYPIVTKFLQDLPAGNGAKAFQIFIETLSEF